MPRPQNFNETEVLNAAMLLFWSHGYVATGMARILKVTGLKPGSFYNAFPSKKALFIRTLEFYNESIVGARVSMHLVGGHPLEAISNFFLSSFEAMSERDIFGCLLTNTSTEIGKTDNEINAVVWLGQQKIETAIRRRIVDAQQQGLLNPELDAEATALHLLGCYQGMTVIARVTQDKAKVRSLAYSALRILEIC